MEQRGFELARIFGIFCFAFVLMPMVSAEIFLTQTEDVYNIGDTIIIDVTLAPDTPTNSFLNLDLVCGNDDIGMYRAPYSLDSGEEQVVFIDLFLGRSVVGDISGNCVLEARYGADFEKSQRFEISNSIDFEVELDKSVYDPGESILVFGEAELETGSFVDGFIEAEIVGYDISLNEEVSEGYFEFEIELPEDIESGEKDLNLRVYQKDITGEITNEGVITETFEIREVLSNLEIVLNTQSVVPGEQNLTYSARAYDQANNEIEREVSIEFFDPEDSLFKERIVASGEEIVFSVQTDYAPGYWEIVAVLEDFEESKLFFVEENALIEFEIENQTLIVENVGNVRYSDSIEVSIGDEILVKDVDLKVGETKMFRLSAPDNEYAINVRAGGSEFSAGSVPLTGRAIDIGEVGQNDLVRASLIGFLLLILAIVVAIVLWYKKRKGSFFGGKGKNRIGGKDDVMISASDMGSSGKPVVGGKKENASVICLRLDDFSGDSEPVVENSLLLAKESGAKVYINGEFRIMLFSPSLTKSQDNNSLAVKTAKRIEQNLASFNKKSRDKVHFGIGVNSGQVVIESHAGQIKLTSLGSLISGAKKISSESKEEVLISENLHGKLSGEIKTQAVSGKKLWKIKNIIERQGSGSFVERFKK